MSPATRAEAKKKLSKITVKIGYPDKWRDYSALTRSQRRSRRQSAARLGVRAPAIRDAHGRSGGQGRVADDAADRQRVLQLHDQRDHVPRRHPALAVLRHDGRRRRELRRHRLGDRPRDQPRLRRFRPAVRRRRQPARLVDGRRRREVQAARRRAGQAIFRLHRARQPPYQRRAHARREHRRPVRHGGGVQGVPDLAERQARARDRRLHRSSSASSSAGRRCGAASIATPSCSSAWSPIRTARASFVRMVLQATSTLSTMHLP